MCSITLRTRPTWNVRLSGLDKYSNLENRLNKMYQRINQLTNQLTNQPINQLTNQPINQPTNQPNQLIKQAFN